MKTNYQILINKFLFYDTLLTVKRQIKLNQKIVNLALFCFSNIDEKKFWKCKLLEFDN